MLMKQRQCSSPYSVRGAAESSRGLVARTSVAVRIAMEMILAVQGAGDYGPGSLERHGF